LNGLPNAVIALWWAKSRMARNLLASVRRESRLKVAFVSISAGLLLVGIFALARLVFGLFEDFGAEAFAGKLSFADIVMGRLLSFFAFAVFVLLIFSNALISYATLFRSREMPVLVLAPVPVAELFLGRFAECVTFSSWASAFLGAPLLFAYGLASDAPPFFYLAAVLFYLPFVVIPAALGSLVTLLGLRLVLRFHARAKWLLGIVLVAIGVVFATFRSRFAAPDLSGGGAGGDLRGLLDLLGRSQNPFLPSQWLADGVLKASLGDWAGAGFSLLLLSSTALFFVYLATLAAELFFPGHWSALMGAEESRQEGSRRGILSRLEGGLFFLPEPWRALVAKDLRLFWREPAQWSQFLLFFGIMALYVANARGDAAQAAVGESWRAWGTLLNLVACLLILASLTSRFVYPLISLEGRRIWILGLSPVGLRRVVGQKFWLSVATTASFTLGLTVLTGLRLGLDRVAFGLSLGAVLASTFALSGLAVGLGSLYANFQEDNPSRVVSGLGGTLNFLLSLLHIALTTAGLGAVLVWREVGALGAGLGDGTVILTAGLWILAITTLATWLPLRLGIRHLESIDY
jgi:ABC-2 type transport system permease protein